MLNKTFVEKESMTQNEAVRWFRTTGWIKQLTVFRISFGATLEESLDWLI